MLNELVVTVGAGCTAKYFWRGVPNHIWLHRSPISNSAAQKASLSSHRYNHFPPLLNAPVFCSLSLIFCLEKRSAQGRLIYWPQRKFRLKWSFLDGCITLFVDGVAPRAKMNQQRSRRFRTAKDAEMAVRFQFSIMSYNNKYWTSILVTCRWCSVYSHKYSCSCCCTCI